MDINAFWLRVKQLAKSNNITLISLSEQLGFNSQYINLQSIRKTIPDIQIAEKMADIFNVSLDFLVSGIDNNYSKQIKDIADKIGSLSEDKQNTISNLISYL